MITDLRGNSSDACILEGRLAPGRPDGLIGALFATGFQHADYGSRQTRGLGHAAQGLAGVVALGGLGLSLEALGFVQVVELAWHGNYLRGMNGPGHVTTGRRTV
jgi:hypothetical protein